MQVYALILDEEMVKRRWRIITWTKLLFSSFSFLSVSHLITPSSDNPSFDIIK